MSLLTETGPRVETLREYQTTPLMTLDRDQVALIAALPPGRLQLTPVGPADTFTLRASSWVGSVVLPGLTIRVLPKVEDLRTVFTMMASGADLVDWSSERAPYDGEDLVEGVADLLLREVSQATRRGLVHGYRHTEARLPVLRGRLDIQVLASRPWERWPIPCRYDEFTADVAENRVLLAAVEHVARWPIAPALRRSVADVRQRLAEVGDSPAPLMEAERLRPTPLNEHYQPALALARLVLEGFGLTQASGGVSALSFLVDMNKLFEKWIGDELTTRMWPDLEVSEQHPVALSRSPWVGMAPDLVFQRDGKPVFVADVKYKLTGSGMARTDDYYQLLAYTTAMGLGAGLLIYCRADEAPERTITVVRSGQRLHTRPVDLAGKPKDVVQALDELAETVRRLSAPAGGSTHG